MPNTPFSKSEDESKGTESPESQAFQVFDKNVHHLLIVFNAQRCDIPGMISRLRHSGDEVQQSVTSLIAEPGSTQIEDLDKALALLGKSTGELQDWKDGLLFLQGWMLVMLVTFAEAYLEDVLNLLIGQGLQRSHLPHSIGKNMQRKWVKDILRAGPREWLTNLENFGATGYRARLAEDMMFIWKRRHIIVHTAELPQPPAKALTEFGNAVDIIGSFVKTTNRFVVGFQDVH